MIEISSCVIAKCANNAATSKPYYINCNETADAFFCKQGIFSNDKEMTYTSFFVIMVLSIKRKGLKKMEVYTTEYSILANLDECLSDC